MTVTEVDAATAPDAENLQQRLQQLEADGAKHFDELLYAELKSLLVKTQLLSSSAQQQILEKINIKITALEQALTIQKNHAEQSLINLQAQPLSTDLNPLKLLLHEKKYRAAEAFAKQLKLTDEYSRENKLDLKALSKLLSHSQTHYNPAQTGFVFDEILRQQEQQTMQSFSENPDPSKKSSTEPPDRMDLQAKRALEDDWHKSNAEKLVAQLIAQGPENPGPLNPHTLAIKALSHMRDLSPHYLYRFISYIDTLLWLDKTQSRLESQPRSKHSKKT